MSIKLATYNIQYGYGQDGKYDLARITEAIRDQDIICLQEVTTAWPQCQGDDQPAILMDALDMYGVYAPGFELEASSRNNRGKIVHRRAGFGNMVLSRWPLIYSRAHSLSRTAVEIPTDIHPKIDFPRVALETVLLAGEVPLRVISVHLSHLPGSQRPAQVEDLLHLARNLPQQLPLWEDHRSIAAWTGGHPAPPVEVPTMILGDFNFTPQDAEYATITRKLTDGWEQAVEKGTDARTCTHSDGTTNRLDYLFVSPDFTGQITSARVDHGTTASDHFPVFFEVINGS